MALSKLELRITVPTAGYRFTLNDGSAYTITIPAGDYYLTTGTTGNSLLTEIKTQLDASASALVFTVTLDDTNDGATGKVTISATGNFQITEWTSTTLRDILGYTTTLTPAATSFQSPEQAEYLWLPNVGRTEVSGPNPTATTSPLGFEEADYIITESPSGETVATTYNRRERERFAFAYLIGRKVHITNESTVNESFQKFWRTLISAGGPPFRFYPDRADDTIYWTCRIANGGIMQPQSINNVYGAQGLWSIGFDAVKLV